MGVISYCCKETGEVFLGISKDTRADFNSTNMKLSDNWHPNKLLQELWNKYGSEGFELSVARQLTEEEQSLVWQKPPSDIEREAEKRIYQEVIMI